MQLHPNVGVKESKKAIWTISKIWTTSKEEEERKSLHTSGSIRREIECVQYMYNVYSVYSMYSVYYTSASIRREIECIVMYSRCIVYV